MDPLKSALDQEGRQGFQCMRKLLCFDTKNGLKFNITKPCQYKLVSKKGHV